MNCKPGDVAFVIKSRTPSNVGLIVDVVQAYSPSDSGIVQSDQCGQVWLCRSRGSPLKWQTAYSIGTEQRAEGPIPDECLRPVRSAPSEQHVHDSANVPHSGVVIAQQTECA